MTIRITALIKRRPDLTLEQFSEHWSKNHAAIFTSLKACKVHLIRYNQFHVSSAHSDMFSGLGLPIAPYDGAAEFEVEKVEDLLAFFGDEEYQKRAIPDEVNFLDRTSYALMVGENQLKYQKE